MSLWRAIFAAACIAGAAASATAGPALDAMRGYWTADSCDNAGEWRVAGRGIEFAWPELLPVDLEQVVSETGSRVETVGISPGIEGVRFAYIISADKNSVLIKDSRYPNDQVVRRCSGFTH